MASKKDLTPKFILSAAALPAAMRPALERPFVAIVDGKRWLAATDGHRAHLVLRTDLSPILYAVGQQVILGTDGTMAPLADGHETPELDLVIPRTKQDLRIVRVETEILRQLASAGPGTTSSSRLRLAFIPEGVCVIGSGMTGGFKVDQKTACGFHPRYVHDALIGVDSAEVEVELRGPKDPAILYPAGGKGSRMAVIMPIYF